MVEVAQDYPTALAADPRQPDLAIRTAMQWVLAKQVEVGGDVLVFAPGMQNINQNPLLASFCKRPRTQTATWRKSASGWSGGPALAVWPNRAKLAEIADRNGVRALALVPWVDGEVDAWAAAAHPELLTGAEPGPLPDAVDPVVAEGLKALTAMVNHSNNLAGALDKRDAIAVLTTLYQGGHALDPQAIYTWALANGWPGRGAERLREMAERIGSGHRMRTNTSINPLRPDALARWRDNGSVQ